MRCTIKGQAKSFGSHALLTRQVIVIYRFAKAFLCVCVCVCVYSVAYNNRTYTLSVYKILYICIGKTQAKEVYIYILSA